MSDGYCYKWVSTREFEEARGFRKPTEKDDRQKRAVAAGWEPVPDGEQPTHLSPEKPPIETGVRRRWVDLDMLDPAKAVQQGSLRLYRMPEDQAVANEARLQKLSERVQHDPEEHFLRDQHPAMPKFASVKANRTEPPERLNYRKYIDEFPENPTDEFRENAECIIDDFLFPAIAYKAEHAGFIDEIRAKLKQLPFTAEAWAVYMQRHDGFDVGANYQEAADRDRAARKVLYASQYESLPKTPNA